MAIYGNYDHKMYWYPHFPRNPQFPSQALKAEDFKSLGLGDLLWQRQRNLKSVGLMGKNIGNASVKLRHGDMVFYGQKSQNHTQLFGAFRLRFQDPSSFEVLPRFQTATNWSTADPWSRHAVFRTQGPHHQIWKLIGPGLKKKAGSKWPGSSDRCWAMLGTRSLDITRCVSGKIWVPLLDFAGFETWTWYFLGVSRSNTELPATVPLGEPGRR